MRSSSFTVHISSDNKQQPYENERTIKVIYENYRATGVRIKNAHATKAAIKARP